MEGAGGTQSQAQQAWQPPPRQGRAEHLAEPALQPAPCPPSPCPPHLFSPSLSLSYSYSQFSQLVSGDVALLGRGPMLCMMGSNCCDRSCTLRPPRKVCHPLRCNRGTVHRMPHSHRAGAAGGQGSSVPSFIPIPMCPQRHQCSRHLLLLRPPQRSSTGLLQCPLCQDLTVAPWHRVSVAQQSEGGRVAYRLDVCGMHMLAGWMDTCGFMNCSAPRLQSVSVLGHIWNVGICLRLSRLQVSCTDEPSQNKCVCWDSVFM